MAKSLPPTPNTEQVARALQLAWNEYVGDTHCFPDCFKVTRAPKLWADFSVGNFAAAVAG